ncbi:MAG: hypothetical protein ACOC6G_00440 [Thermoproteota archaeon]
MELGEEAKKLDEQSILQRAKLEKSELRRVIWAIIFYFGVLGLMFLFM